MKEEVYKTFEILNIQYEKVSHPALFKCSDDEMHNVHINGMVCKNLFLRNKDKSKYYLYSLPINKRADLKSLESILGESKLSFGSEEALTEKLNIPSGSASVLNVIGAPSTDVIFLIDKEIYNYAEVGFHPNDNTETLVFFPKDIDKILTYFKVKYIIV